MATNFPTSLDTSTTLPAESGTTPLATNHVTAHQNLQDAVEAIEAKLGADSSVVTTSHDYKLSEVTSSDKAVGKSATQTLTNKTLTTPVLSGDSVIDSIKSSGSSGTTVKNSSGGSVADFGTAGSTNASLHGAVNINVDSTDYGQITGGTGTWTQTATGGSTNINVNIVPKGTGRLQVGAVNVPTVSSTDTLTNKTLTTPTITKPVMDATNPTAQTYSPSSGGTATLDLSLGNQHRIQMPAGNITIALSNDTNSQIFTVRIKQDGTGSRTVTWFSGISWATGTVPTLTTTANKADMFIFVRTGSATYDGFIVGQNI